MKNYRIERTSNFISLLGRLFLILIFIGLYGSLITPYAFVFAIVLMILFGYLWYSKYKLVKDRKLQIEALAQANGYQLYGNATESLINTAPDFKSTSLAMLAKEQSDIRVDNRVMKDDWAYGDYSFNFYRRSRFGKLKAGKVHYAVIGFTLPRELPHVIFDSSVSNKKQFRMVFDGSQKHSLEGNFDKYFSTYFAPDYTIDSMSFITPEVMQAMTAASDYDIEIVDNKLYLFGPIEHPAAQIQELISHGSEVKKKLLNNILTYRDQRLDVVSGRQAVAAQGMRLKRSKWPRIIFAITVALYIISHIADIIFQLR